MAFVVALMPACGQEVILQGEMSFEVTGLEVPESFQYDLVTGKYFISNIVGKPAEKDGNGYITRLDENGKVEEKAFIDKLDAPKGMAIFQGQSTVSKICKKSQILLG